MCGFTRISSDAFIESSFIRRNAAMIEAMLTPSKNFTYPLDKKRCRI
jgi:hypothetical protein